MTINPLKARQLRREHKKRELDLAERQADIEERRLKQQARMMRLMHEDMERQRNEQAAPGLQAPALLSAVVPADKTPAVAMDSCQSIYQYADSGIGQASFYSSFPGYPALAVMSQSSDYRSVAETTATEMTREWGQFKIEDPDVEDDSELTDEQMEARKAENEATHRKRLEKINALNDSFNLHGIRELVRKAVEVEYGMGRAQIYISLEGHDDSLPFVMNSVGVKKGELKGFRLIEPMWSTPSVYNANDPTAPDFYSPTKWFVLGREVHSDRLMTLIMRPVPDMLKPAYNFGGISMFQLMKPYVERYQRTADSVAQIVRAFSLTILATDMSGILADGESDAGLWLRAGLFNRYRDNSGMMLLDKESEELSQINTPLTSLPEILTKSQEQMAAPSHTPLVKLLGITPSGLNANSDGEIRVYYDYISAQQEAHLRPIIEKISALIQLDLFGEVDNGIAWEFNPLYQLNAKELAETQEIKGRNAAQLIDKGVVSAEEVRQTLASDPDSPFSGIDVDDVPEPSVGDFDELMGGFAQDEFVESEHPRDEKGRFTSVGGGALKSGQKVKDKWGGKFTVERMSPDSNDRVVVIEEGTGNKYTVPLTNLILSDDKAKKSRENVEKEKVKEKESTGASSADNAFGAWRGDSGHLWPEDGKEPKILFHNGTGPEGSFVVKEEVNSSVNWGGVFVGPNAGMDGERRYSVALDPSKGLTHYDFRYSLDFDDAAQVLRDDYKGELSDEDLDFIWDFITEDRFDNDSDLLDDEDEKERFESIISGFHSYSKTDNEPGYTTQRLRGLIAKELGYQWVEMEDETGISTLVLPGVELRELEGGESYDEASMRIYDQWVQDMEARN